MHQLNDVSMQCVPVFLQETWRNNGTTHRSMTQGDTASTCPACSLWVTGLLAPLGEIMRVPCNQDCRDPGNVSRTWVNFIRKSWTEMVEWEEKDRPREGRQRLGKKCTWCKAQQFCPGDTQATERNFLQLMGTAERPRDYSQKWSTLTLLQAANLLCSITAAAHLPPSIP